MTEILRFLEARLAEDEAIARAIDDKQFDDSGWSMSYNDYGLATMPSGWYIAPHIGLAYEEEGARHIATFNPERILREIEAKRRIMARHREVTPDGELDWAYSKWDAEEGRNQGCVGCFVYGDPDMLVTDDIDECPELRDLASIYRDHPDYLKDWDDEV